MNDSDSIKEFREWLAGESAKAEDRYLSASADMREQAGTVRFVPAMEKFREALDRHREARVVVSMLAEWREATGGKE